jgi:hypothetical protein
VFGYLIHPSPAYARQVLARANGSDRLQVATPAALLTNPKPQAAIPPVATQVTNATAAGPQEAPPPPQVATQAAKLTAAEPQAASSSQQGAKWTATEPHAASLPQQVASP